MSSLEPGGAGRGVDRAALGFGVVGHGGVEVESVGRECCSVPAAVK